MIVCSCNVLSDCQIRSTVEPECGGARTPGQVYRCLGCSPQCGRCARTIKSILDKALGACDAANAACAGCPAHVAAEQAGEAHHHDGHHHRDLLQEIVAAAHDHQHAAA